MRTDTPRRLLAAALAAALAIPAMPAALAAPSDAAATALLETIDASYAANYIRTESTLDAQFSAGNSLKIVDTSHIDQDKSAISSRADITLTLDSSTWPAEAAIAADTGSDTVKLTAKATAEADMTADAGGTIRMRLAGLQVDSTGTTGDTLVQIEAAMESIKLITEKTFGLTANGSAAAFESLGEDAGGIFNTEDSIAKNKAMLRALIIGRVLLVESMGNSFNITLNTDASTLNIAAAADELRNAPGCDCIARQLDEITAMNTSELQDLADTYESFAQAVELAGNISIQSGRISTISMRFALPLSSLTGTDNLPTIRIDADSTVSYSGSLPVSTLPTSGTNYINIDKLMAATVLSISNAWEDNEDDWSDWEDENGSEDSSWWRLPTADEITANMPRDAWYYTSIRDLIERDIIQGFVDVNAPMRHRYFVDLMNDSSHRLPYADPIANLAPYATMTKRQVLLMAADSAAEKAGATDVVAWAKSRGIVGANFEATADSPATTAEALTILARTLREYERLLRANGEL